MVSGIAIIIIVFLPLLSLQGLEGKLFAPVALTISFALGGSLLLSLTVIPVLASFLMRRVEHHEPWLPRKLGELYQPGAPLANADKYATALAAVLAVEPGHAAAMAAQVTLAQALGDTAFRREIAAARERPGAGQSVGKFVLQGGEGWSALGTRHRKEVAQGLE